MRMMKLGPETHIQTQERERERERERQKVKKIRMLNNGR